MGSKQGLNEEKASDHGSILIWEQITPEIINKIHYVVSSGKLVCVVLTAFVTS
jgi:hypothetical protein